MTQPAHGIVLHLRDRLWSLFINMNNERVFRSEPWRISDQYPIIRMMTRPIIYLFLSQTRRFFQSEV